MLNQARQAERAAKAGKARHACRGLVVVDYAQLLTMRDAGPRNANHDILCTAASRRAHAAADAGACLLLLVGIGGFGWFDAVCHAFATLATGGFSTRVSIDQFGSLGAEVVLTVFMFLSGASFAFLAAHWRSGPQAITALLRSGEFRLYAVTTAALIGSCTLALVRADVPFGTALRLASFNGVSVLTSTGFATSDFQAWPTTCLLVLFAAMLVGGCAGSTAGGIKQIRLLVVLKLLGYTVRQFVRPRIVERIKIDEETLPAVVVSSVLAITMMWLLTNSPTCWAALAPASTAARTLPTSPLTIVVT
jgi:Trk-type K+ transport system membrane component